MRNILLPALFLLMVTSAAQGDVIHLRNGHKVEVDQTWEKDGYVFGRRMGANFKFSKEVVEKITDRKVWMESGQRPRFGYGQWVLGMTLYQIFDLAEAKNIPLSAGSRLGKKHGFDPAIRSHGTKAGFFHYEEDQLGRRAKIKLYITPTTKRLYRIDIRFMGMDIKRKSELRTKVESMLVQKHGSPQKSKRPAIFYDDLRWSLKNNYQVVLKAGESSLVIEYHDLLLARQAKREKFQQTRARRAEHE